jgi:hypothetical protein
LGEDGHGSGKSGGDDDGLNERFHDYYLQDCLWYLLFASSSLREPMTAV